MKVKSESEVAQSCLTPSDPMDCSLPGSSIHGIFQARVLEWAAIAFSGPKRWGESKKEIINDNEMISSIKELELFDREGNGTPLQYSCLENPMDAGAC